MAENVVAKLKDLLALAEAGEVTHLAYHYDAHGKEMWGFLNVSEHGQLVIPARLSALAIENRENDEGEGD